jgi:hypothetical protein
VGEYYGPCPDATGSVIYELHPGNQIRNCLARYLVALGAAENPVYHVMMSGNIPYVVLRVSCLMIAAVRNTRRRLRPRFLATETVLLRLHFWGQSLERFCWGGRHIPNHLGRANGSRSTTIYVCTTSTHT